MSKVLSACRELNCIKIMKDGECLAFLDPKYQWRTGSCYGFSNNKEELSEHYYDEVRHRLECCKGEDRYFIEYGERKPPIGSRQRGRLLMSKVAKDLLAE